MPFRSLNADALNDFGALRVAQPSGTSPQNSGWSMLRKKLNIGSIKASLGEDESKGRSPKATSAHSGREFKLDGILPDTAADGSVKQRRATFGELPDIQAPSTSPKAPKAPALLGAGIGPPSPGVQLPPAPPVARSHEVGRFANFGQPAGGILHVSPRQRWSSLGQHVHSLGLQRRRATVDHIFSQGVQEVSLARRINLFGADLLPISNAPQLPPLASKMQTFQPTNGLEDESLQDGLKAKGWSKARGVSFAAAAFGMGDAMTSRTAGSDELKSAASWAKIREQGLGGAGEERENFAKSSEPGFVKLAATFVNRFGSLERAFANFDHNHKGKFTRGQWETTVAVMQMDTQEICGLPAKKVFRAIDTMDGGPSKMEVTQEQWMRFFERELNGTEAESLLAEDRGCQAPRRWAQMKKLPLNVLTVLASGAPVTEASFRRQSSTGSSKSHKSGDLGASQSISELTTSSSEAGSRTASKHGGGAHSENLKAIRRRQVKFGTGEVNEVAENAWEDLLACDTEADEDEEGTDEEGEESDDSKDEAGNFKERWAKMMKEGKNPVLENISSGDGDSSSSSEEEGGCSRKAVGAGAVSSLSMEKQAMVGSRKFSDLDQSKINHDRVMQALNGQLSDAVLAEMTEAELQVIAEQQQLERDLAELELKHIEAFAYVLIAKLGSLKKAFKWFDYNRTHKLTSNTWGTGVKLLHIDTEKLTGWSAGHIFFRIDVDPSDGVITRKKWKEFFKNIKLPTEEALAAMGLEFRKRVTAKQKKFKKRASCFRGDRNTRKKVARVKAESLDDGDDIDEAKLLAMEEVAYRAKILKELAAIPEGGSLNFWNFRGTAESRLLPSRRRQIVLECARALALWTLADSEDSASLDESTFDLRRSKTDAVIAAAPEEGTVLICNFKQFAGETEMKLKAIPEGGSLAFPVELTDLQRAVVHMVAAKLELATLSEGRGTGRYVVAYDSGNFADEARQQMELLGAGQSHEFSADISAAQRRMVHAMAAELGLSVRVRKDADGKVKLEVFNMANFINDKREELSNLGVGEVKLYGGGLTEEEQQAIHAVAAELGLTSSERGGRGNRQVVVSNCAEFLSAANQKMNELSNLQDAAEFAMPEKADQREAFWDLAGKMGFELDSPQKSRSQHQAHEVAHMIRTRFGEGREFLNRFATRMKNLNVDDIEDFELPELPEERQAFFELARKMGFEVEPPKQGSREELAKDAVRLRRTNLGEAPKKASAQVEEPASGSSEPELNRSTSTHPATLIESAFNIYATGHQKGEKIFLRFVDLKEFAEDLRGVMPKWHGNFRSFTALLEVAFDDTLSLQTDFGVLVGPGLTRRFFQVFIQKAMHRLGMGIAAVLLAVLDEEAA
mmetsp:Transcript_73741/g.130211  ORF Transcript_73741/g.130211 Transcript_73741/m.130211 type:complete len:1363 (-) Transcript_73741:104-4192(-)